MRQSTWVLAYHGCDKKIGEKILGGEEVIPSANVYDWLGTGAYFWENSPFRALEWAELLRAQKRIKTAFVIGAVIDPGNCLDLSEARCLDVLKAAHRDFTKVMAKSRVPMPKNERAHPGDHDLLRRNLDCAVINFLHELRRRQKTKPPQFDTIRSPFLEGGELFPGSKISARTHVQWCVRDPRKSIIGYFRPRPDSD